MTKHLADPVKVMVFKTCVVSCWVDLGRERMGSFARWHVPLLDSFTIVMKYLSHRSWIVFSGDWADQCPWKGNFNLPYMSTVFHIFKNHVSYFSLLYERVMSSWYFTCVTSFWCRIGIALYILAFLWLADHRYSLKTKRPLHGDNSVMTVLID